jgi:hypothetical protein
MQAAEYDVLLDIKLSIRFVGKEGVVEGVSEWYRYNYTINHLPTYQSNSDRMIPCTTSLVLPSHRFASDCSFSTAVFPLARLACI